MTAAGGSLCFRWFRSLQAQEPIDYIWKELHCLEQPALTMFLANISDTQGTCFLRSCYNSVIGSICLYVLERLTSFRNWSWEETNHALHLIEGLLLACMVTEGEQMQLCILLWNCFKHRLLPKQATIRIESAVLNLTGPALIELLWPRKEPAADIERRLRELVEQSRPTREYLRAREIAFQRLDEVLVECFDIHGRLFGSAVNGFEMLSSDIDVIVLLPKDVQERLIVESGIVESDPSLKGNPLRAACLAASNKLGHALKNSPKFMVVDIVKQARVPIVKCRYTPHDEEAGTQYPEIDVSFLNEVACYNSKLLRAYAEFDERAMSLGLLVKLWAKRRKINSPLWGTLSSYSYTLMVVHYLQRLGLLPNLQRPRAEVLEALGNPCTEHILDGGHNVWFADPDDLPLDAKEKGPEFWLGEPPPKLTLLELLYGFFRYFALEFNVYTTVVSTRTSELSKFQYFLDLAKQEELSDPLLGRLTTNAEEDSDQGPLAALDEVAREQSWTVTESPLMSASVPEVGINIERVPLVVESDSAPGSPPYSPEIMPAQSGMEEELTEAGGGMGSADGSNAAPSRPDVVGAAASSSAAAEANAGLNEADASWDLPPAATENAEEEGAAAPDSKAEAAPRPAQDESPAKQPPAGEEADPALAEDQTNVKPDSSSTLAAESSKAKNEEEEEEEARKKKGEDDENQGAEASNKALHAASEAAGTAVVASPVESPPPGSSPKLAPVNDVAPAGLSASKAGTAEVGVGKDSQSLAASVVDAKLVIKAVATPARHIGKVKSFDADKGFGFIICEVTQERYKRDVFLHSSQRQEAKVDQGDFVSFIVQENQRGEPQARDVKKIDPADLEMTSAAAAAGPVVEASAEGPASSEQAISERLSMRASRKYSQRPCLTIDDPVEKLRLLGTSCKGQEILSFELRRALHLLKKSSLMDLFREKDPNPRVRASRDFEHLPEVWVKKAPETGSRRNGVQTWNIKHELTMSIEQANTLTQNKKSWEKELKALGIGWNIAPVNDRTSGSKSSRLELRGPLDNMQKALDIINAFWKSRPAEPLPPQVPQEPLADVAMRSGREAGGPLLATTPPHTREAMTSPVAWGSPGTAMVNSGFGCPAPMTPPRTSSPLTPGPIGSPHGPVPPGPLLRQPIDSPPRGLGIAQSLAAVGVDRHGNSPHDERMGSLERPMGMSPPLPGPPLYGSGAGVVGAQHSRESVGAASSDVGPAGGLGGGGGRGAAEDRSQASRAEPSPSIRLMMSSLSSSSSRVLQRVKAQLVGYNEYEMIPVLLDESSLFQDPQEPAGSWQQSTQAYLPQAAEPSSMDSVGMAMPKSSKRNKISSSYA